MQQPFQAYIFFGFLALCFYLLPVASNAQVLESDSLEFGTVPDSLFSMQEYGEDPSAPFVYMLKEADIRFENDDRSIIAVLDYYVRIKIFDASVQQASVVAIPYYFERGIEEIQNIRAITHSPEGQKTTLAKSNVRTININSRYNVKEFTMPNVEDGSVLEYAYQIRRRYIEELPDFFLAHQAPTALAKASITYPHYLRYDVIPVDFDGRLQNQSQRIDTSSVKKIFTVPQPDPILKETWVAKNVPAIKEEAYISSIDDYRGKLKFKLSEFGNPRQKLENSWDFVVAELRRNQNVLEKIAGYTQAKALGRDIAQEFKNKEAIQDSIFRHLNSSMNYNGSRSPFSNVSDKQVLNGNLADQAAINQTLLAMLRGAGIEAYPMLISTREFGQIDRSFPSFFQFNGQLVYSEINKQPYFMDASFAYSQPNLIPITTYNENGLMLKEEDYQWKEITPLKSKFDISITIDARLDEEGNLSGSISSESSGYPAQVIREKYSNGQRANNIIREAIFDGYSNIELRGQELNNLQDYENPVVMNTEFMLPNYATSFSDGLELRPMVVGYLMSNPFNEGNRDLPVTLDAPEKLDLVYNIQLPDGFTFDEGAENRSIQLPGASFTESYDTDGKTLRYEFHIDISKKQFEPEVYPQLLDLYERWVRLSNGKWLIKR
ncbi:MAG: DUF3857 domain-containing protein [Balneolaceae bacterium]|nr:DUF3857 domain-containing protein [Balneolaceae bacterium]